MADVWGVVITAAGSSTRMGIGGKKEFRLLDGQPVISRTCAAFFEIAEISVVVVVVREQDCSRTNELFGAVPFNGKLIVASGGTTRQESVRRGLAAIDSDPQPDYVLIHDGARPWVTTDLIRRVIKGTCEFGACIPVIPSRDALVLVDNGFATEHIERNRVKSVQTPQGFRFPEILDAHLAALHAPISVPGENGYVDDASLYASAGHRVAVTDGDAANRKITFSIDLEEAL